MLVRPFSISEEPRVTTLWHESQLIRASNRPHADILLKLRADPELFLVGDQKARLVAAVMASYEGQRGWMNDLAIAPDVQKMGPARLMVDAVESRLRASGCPKINLQARRTNIEAIQFYQKSGFVEDEVVNFGKRLVQE